MVLRRGRISAEEKKTGKQFGLTGNVDRAAGNGSAMGSRGTNLACSYMDRRNAFTLAGSIWSAQLSDGRLGN